MAAKKKTPAEKAPNAMREREIARFAAISAEDRKAMLDDTARRQNAASTRPVVEPAPRTQKEIDDSWRDAPERMGT